jgi:hypothetical protein
MCIPPECISGANISGPVGTPRLFRILLCIPIILIWSASPGQQSPDMWIHNTHHIELGPEHKISPDCISRKSLQTWIQIMLVWSISPTISPECMSGVKVSGHEYTSHWSRAYLSKESTDMDTHHIGLEY